ncbi:MAG TPA: NAD(P)-dependent oxidoreductase, partial [Gemmatimonadaceae bacterium]|nr:NAD(P)-dependent oxidoreductase [Gemmatimonadaceae bacterium]
RYPHIRYVTPVNEPLTTARFSGLYGHWYPHHKSPASFARALLNQCHAIRDSMHAMRDVIPELQLVQTEDLGRTSSTDLLAYQARFENERRWLTFDLLSGRVNRSHPLWNHLVTALGETTPLRSLVADPCVPDVLGINYYVTSERFLDDRVEHYSADTVGGNGKDSYADVEAVRMAADGICGHAAILQQTWARYRLPVAVTEVHLGCTREQQMRWLVEAWNGANQAKDGGCDVRAITAWALFGSFGWDSLVTSSPFHYESGAFDVRSSTPRPTALAGVINSLAVKGACVHPAAFGDGWWRQEHRLSPHSIAATDKPVADTPRLRLHRNSWRKPLIVAGARGTLGGALRRICNERGIRVCALDRSELDITSATSIRRALDTHTPWAVVNAAGYVRVDDAELNHGDCDRANTMGASLLAAATAMDGIPLVTFSSDLVFDGSKQAPYVETDLTHPLNAYGVSKAIAEQRVSALHRHALIIRTSAFFGPWDGSNFVTAALSSLSAGIPFLAADDLVVAPTYVPDLVHATLDLLIDGEHGIWHLANDGAITWAALAKEIASRAGYPESLVHAVPHRELGRQAPQPSYSALGSERSSLMPSLESAITRYFRDIPSPVLSGIPAAAGAL